MIENKKLKIDKIKEAIEPDLKRIKILEIRKTYKKKEDIEKVLVIQRWFNCSKLTKTIDLLINEKYQKIQFASDKNLTKDKLLTIKRK